MSIFLSETIGTCLLILFGNGVVANVVLKATKGNNGGWVVITLGWAMAVYVAVFVTQNFGNAVHLNPVFTVANVAMGKIGLQEACMFIAGQLLGAFVGACLVWLIHKPHIDITEDAGAIEAMFCTAPAIKNPLYNFISELLVTAALVFAALHIAVAENNMGSLQALPVALLVLGIGLCLGGATGYAVNPARDFAPRVAHALLPIKNKGNSNWQYAWIPIVAPILGALLAVGLKNLVQ